MPQPLSLPMPAAFPAATGAAPAASPAAPPAEGAFPRSLGQAQRAHVGHPAPIPPEVPPEPAAAPVPGTPVAPAVAGVAPEAEAPESPLPEEGAEASLLPLDRVGVAALQVVAAQVALASVTLLQGAAPEVDPAQATLVEPLRTLPTPAVAPTEAPGPPMAMLPGPSATGSEPGGAAVLPQALPPSSTQGPTAKPALPVPGTAAAASRGEVPQEVPQEVSREVPREIRLEGRPGVPEAPPLSVTAPFRPEAAPVVPGGAAVVAEPGPEAAALRAPAQTSVPSPRNPAAAQVLADAPAGPAPRATPPLELPLVQDLRQQGDPVSRPVSDPVVTAALQVALGESEVAGPVRTRVRAAALVPEGQGVEPMRSAPELPEGGVPVTRGGTGSTALPDLTVPRPSPESAPTSTPLPRPVGAPEALGTAPQGPLQAASGPNMTSPEPELPAAAVVLPSPEGPEAGGAIRRMAQEPFQEMQPVPIQPGLASGAIVSTASPVAFRAQAPPVEPPTPPPAPAALPWQEAPRVGSQVEGSITWMLRQRGGAAELQLHPENLGKVVIQLRVEGQEVHAKVWASEAGTVPLIQEHRASLEVSLQQQGLNLGSFDLQHGARQGRFDQEAQAARAAFLGQVEAVAPAPQQDLPVLGRFLHREPGQVEVYA